MNSQQSPARPGGSAPDAESLSAVVVYDKKTGRILESQRYASGEDGSDADRIAEALADARDNPYTLDRLSGSPEEHLAAMVVSEVSEPLLGKKMVDVGSGKVVDLPRLELHVHQNELEGNGVDETKIDVNAVDARGKLVGWFSGRVHVQTTRGKLSERGGVVTMKSGKGTIRLRSVDETVSKVVVRATGMDMPCTQGNASVAFT